MTDAAGFQLDGRIQAAEEALSRVHEARVQLSDQAEAIAAAAARAIVPHLKTAIERSTESLVQLHLRATSVINELPHRFAAFERHVHDASAEIQRASAQVETQVQSLQSAVQNAESVIKSFEDDVIDKALPACEESISSLLTNMHETVFVAADEALDEVRGDAVSMVRDEVSKAIDEVVEPVLEDLAEYIRERIDGLMDGSAQSLENSEAIGGTSDSLDSAAKPVAPVVESLFALL
jgi:hypothetical protein